MPVSERLFRYIAALEIDKAERLRYYVSLVCLAPDISREGIDWHLADRRLSDRIARLMVRQLRRTDLVTTLRGEAVGLLLVDADPRAIPPILDRVSGGLRRFGRGRELVSVSAGASCYPATARSDAQLFREATNLLHRAREEGGDRLLLPPALTSPAS